jgi:hypothetical protein
MTWAPACRSVAFPAHSPNPIAASAQPSTTGRLAPPRSSIRPPICAQTTNPKKKYKMSRLDVVAFSASAICPYSAAKKNTGMNAICAMNKMMFSTVNA